MEIKQGDKFKKDGNIYTLIEINCYPTNPQIVGYRLKDYDNDTPYFEVLLSTLEEEYERCRIN